MTTRLLLAALALLVSACGLAVQSADLFLLTRTGAGSRLTLLINDSGTISCNGGAPKHLADPLLLRARDLAASLDTDAKSKLRIRPSKNSIYSYSVKLQDGTLRFPDTAALEHPELAQAESFTLQVGQRSCGVS
jgi:hypothetical protein